MPSRDKQVADLRCNVNFGSHAPIPIGVLSSNLIDNGYNIQQKTSAQLVASKEHHNWLYDANEGLINLMINDIEFLPESINELRTLLFNEIGLDKSSINHVEIDSDLLVWNGESTIDLFMNLYEAPDLGEHFDSQTTPVSLRYVSDPDHDPSADDIYDIKLESYLQNKNYYYVDINYRKPGFDQLEPMIRSFNSQVDQVIDNIESLVNNND